MTAKSIKNQLAEILSENGPLAQQTSGYQVRHAQVEMAEAVAETIDQQETLLAEAGTGTGKTFAYLIPSLLSGKKVIVSTATKTLQDQLLNKDVPNLLSWCKIDGAVRVLKGRENYLCPQRLELTETAEHHPKDVWKKLSLIQDWQQKTQTGDKAELSELDENDPIWHRVCARLEFCQANECHASEACCFYPKIKQQAADAQVLIVNHHLFCADLALREQGVGEVLPEADIYIFDEAHQLPDIAAQFLGFNLSRYQFDELVRDLKLAYQQESPDTVELKDQTQQLAEAIQAFNEQLGKWEKRWTREQFQTQNAAEKALKALSEQLVRVSATVKQLADRGKLLSALLTRLQLFEKQLNLWLKTDDNQQIRWLESAQSRFKLNLTPLSVADPFSRQRAASGGAWIFTSATLSVNQSFDYFSQRLGLAGAKTHQWESPFDYAKQAMIYHPIGLPAPSATDYIKICLRAAWPLLQASKGRAFLLFTSHRALQEAKVLLKAHWPGALLVQGDLPKNALLSRFKEMEQPLLLGTSSFWEGVDVKGEALKIVLIDRIPFIPPDDPIVQARETDLRQRGLSGFYHFQIPEAIIALKQGAGRLIRDTSDTGVLILCDPRISQKSYGQLIMNSLPKFKWVYDAETAKEKL
ncbi:ATP-dependent DNA helicase [Hydrogenovibrio sp. SC-1]|uniref:ATP-dependent DNA helicase n=1 Tax=Hydrogenovibrio sp. SC-1 TaxID=2065820 RepID=UPI000C7CFB1D|nr:ATP-dependent DNA helicase [Hydrogenovibrio sp. SC-1]PLA73528.1 ATP-dependent DNA helicase [Hydrogenovibrio sp. SC-1]